RFCVRLQLPAAQAGSSVGVASRASAWRSRMDPLDKLTIDTPEQTALEFPPAGVGSRFVAKLADTAIQIVIGFVLFFALTLSIPTLSRVASIASQWVIAGMIVGFFVIYYGYFAIFEALWNGQTPG